ncbi:hypothetical protein BDW22DRAFT_862949 [Trametopsis cervina]|nr:hypothetical protein BDW22DRAFT_862949 [Trametopsis cervina]
MLAVLPAPFLGPVPLPPNVNWWLDATSFTGRMESPYDYDLRWLGGLPSRLSGTQAARPLPHAVLSFPAIDFSTTHVVVQCEGLPWEILIHAEAGYLTVGHVLDGIHRLLMQPITPNEWRAIGQYGHDELTWEALQVRCRESPYNTTADAFVPKRIDYLGRNCLFGGLVMGGDGKLLLKTLQV